MSKMPSGTWWGDKFRTNNSIELLEEPFKKNFKKFKTALDETGFVEWKRGIRRRNREWKYYRIVSTLRKPQRSYLMHYAWRIAFGVDEAKDTSKSKKNSKILPQNVPDISQLRHKWRGLPTPNLSPSIEWVHKFHSGKIDYETSKREASKMVSEFNIRKDLKISPALVSQHNKGFAIDFSIYWNVDEFKIKNNEEKEIQINTKPHNHLNDQLIEVAKTYGVKHFQPKNKDKSHWSYTGK